MKKKILAMALALMLVVAASVAGTVAWLTAESGNVTNTFSVGDINIDLKEHELSADGVLNNTTEGEVIAEDTYKILPGTKQPKDPFVRVEKGSEACYVFVQVKEEKNVADAASNLKYVEWAIANGWTQLGGTTDAGVSTYYREQVSLVNATDDAVYFVLRGDEDYVTGVVNYSGNLTAGQLEVAENAKPQLIFKAFAVQVEAGDVSDAWDAVNATEKLS